MPASKDKVNTWKIVCKDNCILFNSWYMNNFSILQSSFSTYYSRIYYCTVLANINCKQNTKVCSILVSHFLHMRLNVNYFEENKFNVRFGEYT